jgi:hypothetical protein
VNRSCSWCFEEVGEDCFKVEEDCVYCHNVDWVVAGGTCWERRVVQDVVEMEEWLWYGFECSGCEVDDSGECTCTSGF